MADLKTDAGKWPLFNCMVRPGGNIMHEVFRKEVTSAEVEVLRTLHGADAVNKIEQVGARLMDPNGVRAYLTKQYGPKAVEATFGKFGQMPRELQILPEPSDEQEEAA